MSDAVVTPFYLVGCFALIGAVHWRVWARTLPAFAAGRRARAASLLAALIGIEEVIKTPLVPERIALGAFGLTALQLLAGLATFGAAIWRTQAR